jgi:Na+-transporting methylmalonyl-CoA/oxaloacetate decarboxylase gamma subunit
VQGLAAISAQNGWAMALAGACIVMAGLSVLSFIISQLHKIVSMIEKTAEPAPEKTISKPEPTTESVGVEENILDDLAAAASIYKALTAGLGDTFELTKLYQIFIKENLPHPHITIRALREAGYLTPAGEGSFSWNNV